jgi:hypothetical protein
MGIELLVWVIVVVIVIALLVYAMQSLPLIADPFKSILIVLVILIGVLVIVKKAGVF